MYKEKMVMMAKRMGYVVIGGLIFLIGLGIGIGLTNKESSKKVEEPKKEVATPPKAKDLTNKQVKDFLIAYYTKKDLGENRKRYEPFVTTNMLNELIEIEAEPVNQAYKGYIVDQVFEKADIYVDTENQAAIATVTYKNTQLPTKGSYENALENQFHEEVIKISFLQQGKRYLVNRIDYVALTQPVSQPRNTYKTTNSTMGVQQVEEGTEGDTQSEGNKSDLGIELNSTEATKGEEKANDTTQ